MTNGMTLLDEVAMVSPHKISIKHVTHTYGVGDKAVHALGPVTLDIAEGEFTCLVGPSGCGKSTLLRAIAGLASPSDGQIDLRLPPTHRASVATVFQDYGIFPWKTVEGNVRFALGVLKLSKADARERTDLWLERLGLLDFRRAYPSQLSGGMRQRVAIARAMATEPDVLLMDEPFAALDAQMREMLQEVLLEVSGNSKRTVVFVTHSLEEAIILGDRVLVMSSRPGRIIDDVQVPFPRPRDTAVRQSARFGEIRGQLWDRLRAEVEQQVADQRRGRSS
ncbi:MAG: ABC transporter ATP-binding protein [Nocardioides sp.]|nr:ABC transporter ATP-binding protein [Nocardioides sp.]